MKKEKSQAPGKGAKKQIKESIQKRLEKFLTTITGELGDKTHIDIAKESRKLAKKLIKGFVVKETPKPAAPAEAPVKETIVKPVAKAPTPVKEAKATKPAPATKKTAAIVTVIKPAPAKAETTAKTTLKPAAPKAVKNGAVKTAKK